MGAKSELAANDRALDLVAMHPDEIKASVSYQLGGVMSFHATARATPAGVIAAALFVSMVVGTALWAARSRVSVKP